MATRNADLHGSAPDKCETALLLIDVINDLEFPEAEQMLDRARTMAKNIRRLTQRARKAGVPVIYVNDNFGRWQSDFRRTVEHCGRSRSRGRALVRILKPARDDYFVLKPKHSGFFSSTLETLLRYLEAKTLILTGIAGNFCVLFTANDAYMRDFELFIPQDCCVSNTPRENEEALVLMREFLKADTRPSDKIALRQNRKSVAPGRDREIVPAVAREKIAWHKTNSLFAPMPPVSRPVSDESIDPVIETQVFWVKHRMEILMALLAVLIALAAYGGYHLYTAKRDASAAELLANAKGASDFQKVFSDYPDAPAAATAYLRLADAQKKDGKFAEANATLQNFLQNFPKHELVANAKSSIAGNLESLGKNDEALEMYRRVAAEHPRAFNAPLVLLAEIPLLKQKGQIDDARRVCETVLTQYRDSYASQEASRYLRLLKPKTPTPPVVAAPAISPAPVLPTASTGPKP